MIGAAMQAETAVRLGGWDWAFLVWFLAVTTGVGLWYARRAGKNLQEYFLSGRNLPWWALGTSIVATNFAADTPLVVAGFVLAGGIAQNWVWWNFLFGATLTVFLFSKLWRRAAVVTEIELIALRYDGRAARVLRGFKALFLGLVVNSIIFGFVTRAMLSVVAVLFPDLAPAVALAVLLAITLVYTTLSGLWGVVATDVLQFVMAMVGAVLLAVIAVSEVGGLGELVERVQSVGAEYGRDDLLAIVPTDWGSAFTAGVVILVLVNWWAVYYPGAEPGGGGYVVQRMAAARDEQHARAGNLWSVFAHYVLRPWPWVLVGLCAIVLEPQFLAAVEVGRGLSGAELDAALAARGLQEFHPPEKAYPWTFHLLPVGLLGLVAASFLAAFMSTITTTLNLSASYLVNDLYQPFLADRERPVDERRQVRVARLAVVLVMALGAVVSWVLVSAGEGWVFIMDLTAGSGLVLILRWLWWRVSAWSEISAMLGSAIAFLVVRLGEVDGVLAEATGLPTAQVGLLAIVAFSTLCWLSVTFATAPVGAAHLRAFYERVRPSGAWGPVAGELPPHRMGRDLRMWVASTLLVFGGLFGLGSLLLQDHTVGTVCVVVAAAAGWWLRVLFRQEAAEER